MTRTSLVKNEEIVEKVYELVKNAGKPIDAGTVARKLKINWQTARTILLLLVAEGKVKMIDTTKSWIFFIEKKEEEVKPNEASG